jgi:hypothetical protein
MAQRRMVSNKIINSARFLKMPITARCLYYDLVIRTDDDGIVEAYTVMKSIGCSEDDLRILATKKFVHILNEDLVTYILDWNEHNTIRADRKVDSMYKHLLLQIVPEEELTIPRQRADTKKITEAHRIDMNNKPTTDLANNGQPMDNQWTDNGRHRLGKDRLGKDRLGKDRIGQDKERRFAPPTPQEVTEYLAQLGNNTIDAHYFCDFYASKGWRVGNSTMKDWRAAVRTWIRRSNNSPPRGDPADRLQQIKDAIGEEDTA